MYEEFLKQLGRELVCIRTRKGLTLEEASVITGIHKNVLSNYENNSSILKLGRLAEILKKYDENPDIFFKNVCEYIRNNKKLKEKEK